MRRPEARVAHVRFAGPAREARGARRRDRDARRGDDGCDGGRCGGGVGVGVGVVRAAPGGRVGVGVGDGRGDGEGLRWPVCGHMERVLLLRLRLRSLRLLILLLLLLLGRIRIHGPARARARRRRRVHTTRRHRRHRGCVRVRVWRRRKRRTGSLESDALHRETSVSGLLRTESIDIARVRAAPRPRPRPRGGGARVDRRGRRAGRVERAGAEWLVGGVAVRVGCIVVLSWRACWVVPLLLLLVWAVRAASVARRRQRRRLHFFFVFFFARGTFLALDYLRSCTIPTCGGGEDEIGEQSRKGGDEERKSKVAVEMDGQEGVESSRVSVAPLYSNRLRHRTSGHSGFD